MSAEPTDTSAMTATSLPEYNKPPVIEVVCGIHFKPLESFLAPHTGLLWEKFRSEYPHCQEVPPLRLSREKFDQPGIAELEVRLSDRPPLPRIWFQHTPW